MRKLFIQFYLLLMACFLVMALLVGTIYRLTAERTMEKSLDDLMQGALSLLRAELRHTPPEKWQETLARSDTPLSFDVAIQPLAEASAHLEPQARPALQEGDIIMLDTEDRFLQRMPGSDYVMVAGPIPYLSFMRDIHLLDYLLLALLGLSLALPVFLWMRPHWRDLLKLEQAAEQLGEGDLAARSQLTADSSLRRLGVAFDRMANKLQTLLAAKQRLANGIAHELRTPLVRLRYRLALAENLDESTQEGISRDISALESLIDEMLIYARLDRPEPQLQWVEEESCTLLQKRLEDWRTLAGDKELRLQLPPPPVLWRCDQTLMLRAIDNLIGNALRHAKSQVELKLQATPQGWSITVDDDGPGIAPAERQLIFEPFVRLDNSRNRQTGGYGLGLAIVQSIIQAHQGEIALDDSPLGGARFSLCWPAPHCS
ncbi:MAG: two-component system sensor histidine kinase RstB [Aeromonadaceae bacterium]